MTILSSKKTGIEYIEHCAIRAADERLVYVRKKEAVEQHFSIPNLNTAVLLLGPGTSITQQAARLCAEGNIMVGFCAGGGTPIYFASLNEYREPEYCRSWISLFNDEQARLNTARSFQYRRIELIRKFWRSNDDLKFSPDGPLDKYASMVANVTSVQDLLLAEAECTKKLYGLLARHFKVEFRRETRAKDLFNTYLDSGNYLAYGLAACTLWVLGIPHSYPVVHGKTRRGALVFDVADIIKDSLILPNAFIAAHLKEPDNLARRRMLSSLHDAKALNIMFNAIKEECVAYEDSKNTTPNAITGQ